MLVILVAVFVVVVIVVVVNVIVVVFVPPEHFQGEKQNCSSLDRMISAFKRSFFANLTTFERHSGQKIFSLLKIKNLKIGRLSSHCHWS